MLVDYAAVIASMAAPGVQPWWRLGGSDVGVPGESTDVDRGVAQGGHDLWSRATSRWVWSMTLTNWVCCPSRWRAPRRFLPSPASTRRRSLCGSAVCPTVAAAASRQASDRRVNAACTGTGSTPHQD